MKNRHFFLFLASLLFMMSCREQCLTGEGNLEDETRLPGTFNAVHVECDANVTFHRAEDGQSRIDLLIQKNLSANFSTVVKEGKLVIAHEQCVGKHTPISIDVYLGGEISELRLSGTGEISSSGILPSSVLNLIVEGTSKCTFGFEGSKLEVIHTGTDDLFIKGRTDELRADLSGTGNLELLGVPASRASVNLSGTGDVKVTVTGSLAMDLSGTGNIRYRGTPQIEKQEITGTGDIRQLSGY